MYQINRLFRAWIVLRRRGVGYLWYLLTGYLMPKTNYYLLYEVRRARLRNGLRLGLLGSAVLVLAILTQFWGLLTAIAILIGLGVLLLLLQKSRKALEVSRMQRQAIILAREAGPAQTGTSFTKWAEWPVDSSTRERIEAWRKQRANEEIVIGRIDNDGRVLEIFGPLPGVENISMAEFAKRYRFPLDVVLLDGRVLVRKDFRGDRTRFVREWYNFSFLHAKANVPAVYSTDEEHCVLYKNFIPGPTIRTRLVEAGARILNVQTDHDPELAGLNGEARLSAILARGTSLISRCLSSAELSEIEQQMDAIHRCGIANLSLTFGNIIVDDKGAPWFLDFEGAQIYSSTGNPMFAARRDRDRALFNKIYNRDLLTEKSARQALSNFSQNGLGGYAPIDFGKGLTAGGFWSTDSGTGRWEFFNERIVAPLVAGKRVLDLGSNNGVMPMMMLRAGAREVTGIELSSGLAECAKLVHRIFQWRDMNEYSFQIRNCDMRDILGGDWGEFDVVTAFCSLYYLPEEDMGKVVRRASGLASTMVVQAKTDTRGEPDDNKAMKSSIPFLRDLLQKNGFPHVEVHAAKEYTRPLLVGRVASI